MSSADDGWFYLHNLWRESAGLLEIELPKPKTCDSLDSLRKSESAMLAELDALCLNRFVCGAFRYGKLCARGKPQYERVTDVIRRLREYSETGDVENLIDVINLVRLEFLEGEHPNRHFGNGFERSHTEEKCSD
jgi:hypothetical protein